VSTMKKVAKGIFGITFSKIAAAKVER